MICWNRGESRSVESKSKEVHAESIAKGVVAFSNSQGGVILIGVSDKGEVEGISGDNNLKKISLTLEVLNIILENKTRLERVFSGYSKEII